MTEDDKNQLAELKRAEGDLWSLLRRAMDMADREGFPFVGALVRSWPETPLHHREPVFSARDDVRDLADPNGSMRDPPPGAAWLLAAFDDYCDMPSPRAWKTASESPETLRERVAAADAAASRVRVMLDAVPHPRGGSGRHVVRVAVHLPGLRYAICRGALVRATATQITVTYPFDGQQRSARFWNRPKDFGRFPAVSETLGHRAELFPQDASSAARLWGGR